MKIVIETGDVVKVSVGDDAAFAFNVDRFVLTAYENRAVLDLPDNRRVVIFGDRCAITELGQKVSDSGGWKPIRPVQLSPDETQVA